MSDFTESKWISVKDRLPDKNGEYLCCKFNKYVDILYFVNDFEPLKSVDGWKYIEEVVGFYEPNNYVYSEDSYSQVKNVTHWMQLPELPKED